MARALPTRRAYLVTFFLGVSTIILLFSEIGLALGEPEWCTGLSDQVSFRYCSGGSYQLCALNELDPGPGPLEYSILPPHNDGLFGSIDRATGLWTWSGPNVQPGTYAILFQVSDGVDYALQPFELNVTVTSEPCSCCSGRVGNVDGLGTYPNEVTISDIQVMVVTRFIIGLPCAQRLPCLAEADVNQSGGTDPKCSNITIADIQTLVNHLFIQGPVAAPLKKCL